MPPTLPLIISYFLWGAWAVSWGVAAIWSDRAAGRPPARSEALYRIVTIVGVGLLFGRPLGWPVYSLTGAAGFALVLVQALGFAFCWWARLHLGRLWSSSVERKADHRVVDTGPYGLVRHPIYTGLDTAALALGILDGRPIAMVGSVLLVIGCWIKAFLEEGFLRQELGTAAYDAYAHRVPMLVPFWPARR